MAGLCLGQSCREALTNARCGEQVDWGRATWQAVAKNQSVQRLIEGAHAEARLLREYVLGENEFHVLIGSSRSLTMLQVTSNQIHSPLIHL